MVKGRARGLVRRRGGARKSQAATTTATTATTATVSRRGGRVARGRGRGRRTGNRVPRVVDNSDELNKEVLDLDVNRDATEFFTKNASFDQHLEAQKVNRDRYLATIMAIDDYSIEMTQNAKARSLAAAFVRHDKEMIDFMLNYKKQYGFVDVLKAVTMLDSGREKRAIEKKIARTVKSGSVMKPKKQGVLKNDMNNLTKIMPSVGSFSGAMARHIRKWVRTFSEKELEFFALHMPTEPWRKLANIVHLNPTTDFPTAPWFLPFCYGAEPPKDSLVDRCRLMNEQNVNELIAAFDLPYAYIKKFKGTLNDESKKKIAERQDDLDTIIWWYEDLACPAVDEIIRQRLEKGDKLSLGYGKLMERLLMFKDVKDQNSKVAASLVDNSIFSLVIPIAELRLKNFKSSLTSPVAVLGDASSSMNVAIRTATIISSLLAAICAAKLTFFNHLNFEGKINPKNLSDVLELAYTTQATGSTAPAASLVPYYDKREVVKTFIIVTDEEENTDGKTVDDKGWRFLELFMEYRKNVYPATLIFVSFLHSQHSQGQMYSQFVKEKVPDVLQFKFDRSRPDLTKLDSILGQLCSKSSESFNGRVEKLESELKTIGLAAAFEKIKMLSDLTESQSKPPVY